MRLFIFFTAFFASIASSFAIELINVVVVQDVLADYKKFIGNRDPLKLIDFSGPGTRRDVVELVILQQALNYKNIKYKIVFQEAPNYKRVIESIKQGKAVMGSNTVWKADVDQKYSYVTDATIMEGEFEAGFYVNAESALVHSVKDVKDFKNFIGISSMSWTSDWQALSNLQLKDLHSTATWESMVKMVKAGRGDFLLAPFQAGNDMKLTVGNMNFLPIQNFKIRLSGSRVYTISKKYKNADTILKDFNDGLKYLKSKKLIKKAYTDSGFINPKVENWKFVN